MIDVLTARRFLRALVTDESPTVFQTFDDSDERKKKKETRGGLARKFEGPIEAHAAVLGRFNTPQLGAGVFVQINAGKRGAQNVTGIRAIFVDHDDPTKTLDLSACPPSISVQSSPGKFQHYWLLEGEATVADFRRAQRHLAAALGTDKSIHNADRVMRLPGTLHLKFPDKPFRVKLIQCEPDRRYAIGAVLDAFPVPVGYVDPQPADNEPRSGSDLTEAAQGSLRRVVAWLNRRKVGYTIKATEPNKIILDRCVFNPEHRGDNGMAIKVAPAGGIWAGCWHNSCGGNVQRWLEVKRTIGGWSGRTAGFSLGDHTEMAQRALGDLRTDSPEGCTFFGNALFRYTADTFVWETVSEDEQDRLILSYSGLPKGLTGAMRIKWTDVTGTRRALGRLAAQPKFFDSAPRGIMFSNGFLRVTEDGLQLEPPSPNHRQRERLPFAWDPAAPAERWAAFLREIFAPDEDAEQKILLLQEFAGACLAGLAPRFQKALLLLGEGSNGKSVFLKCIKALFPPNYMSAVRPQDFGNEYYRAMLNGIRVNIVTELPEADILDSEAFKGIVDGSDVTGRVIRQEPFRFCSEAGQLFSANRLPGTVDFSHGFWRRFLILSFNRQFSDAEANTRLPDELVECELPGICVWALRGAARLLQNDEYSIPQSTREALDRWRQGADVVAEFMDNCTEPTTAAAGAIQARDLYSVFRSWLQENGHRVMSSTTFGRRLRALKVSPHKSNGLHFYALRVTYEPRVF